MLNGGCIQKFDAAFENNGKNQSIKDKLAAIRNVKRYQSVESLCIGRAKVLKSLCR